MLTSCIISPMNLEELRHNYRKSILAIADRYGVENIRVFGSVIRDEAIDSSDIDFLVHLKPDADLFDLGGFYFDLENLLESRIDVVPDNARIHYPSIIEEAVLL